VGLWLKPWAAGLTLAVILLASSSKLFAFSSFDFFGGAYHTTITQKALQGEGFSEASLHWICLGNVSVDKFYSEEFSDDRRHFTDMTFDESEDFLEDLQEEIVERADRVQHDYQAYREIMVDFGAYLHTVQDFYAHTNWIEKNLVEGDGAPVPLAPIDFDDFPVEIISPYTLNHFMPPGEAKNVEDYKRVFGHDFYGVEELATLPDQARIRLVASPEKALNHLTLAKDNPNYAAGALRWTPEATTLFEIAADLATRDSVRHWQLLEKELHDEWEERAPDIIKTLRGGWDSAFPIGQESAEITIEDGELRLSSDLVLSVRLTLKPSSWDRAGASQAMAVFARLSRPAEHSHRFNSEGLSDLQMTRDDSKKAFRLAFEANLFGSARTLVKLTPLGEDHKKGQWEAVISLPEEISGVERLLFHTKGQVRTESAGPLLTHGASIASLLREQSQLRLVVDAPRGGWSPPQWVREYLRDRDLSSTRKRSSGGNQ
jgi:hypothetical protein